MHFTVQTVLVNALYGTYCISECTLLYKLCKLMHFTVQTVLVNALYGTYCISECALLYKLY